MFLELQKLKDYASGERQGAPPLSLLADAANVIEETQARMSEVENENRILKNEVADLRSLIKFHTDHAKRTLGIPLSYP